MAYALNPQGDVPLVFTSRPVWPPQAAPNQPPRAPPPPPSWAPPEPGALSVAVNTYQFSPANPEAVAVLDRDPSKLLALYGRQAQRVLLWIWAEVFWLLSLPALFITTLIQTIFRFVLLSVAVPVLIHPLQQLGDHLLKPLLVTLYDSLILPCTTLCANNAKANLMVVRPLSEQLSLIVAPLAQLLSSIRLVQINIHSAPAQKQPSQVV